MIMWMVGWEVLSRAFFHLISHIKVRPGKYRYHKNQEDQNHNLKASLGRRDKAKRLKKIYLRME
jgi:hypothetical protein